MKFLNLTASNFVWNPQRTALVISWPLSKTKHSKRESNPHRITITVQWDLKFLLLLIILLKSLTKTELHESKKCSFRKKFFVFFYYLADKTLPFAQNKAIVLSLRNG